MSNDIKNPRNPLKLIHRDFSSGRFVSHPPPAPSLPPPPNRSPVSRFRLIPVAILLLITVFLVYLFKDLPSPSRLTRSPYPVSTQIFDRNGTLLYDIFADQNRIPVKLADLPPYLKQATIAIEDKDFFSHRGLSVTGIIRASLKNVQFTFCRLLSKNCSLSFQGGSTITQQLVKSALLTPERTIRRKIRELVLTLAVETIYSKDEILEMYLNQVPYGGTAYGIESASQTYFGKKARDLSLAEAALLAGLPAAPTRLSPFGAHPELANERQRLVVNRMLEDGYLTQSQADEAKSQTLDFAPPQIGIRAPHFVLFVKDLLVQKYGEPVVETGGLRVTTSLDLDLQDFSQQTVASEVAKLKKSKVGNAAALVTNPQTGEILAMVGSKDYFDKASDGNVNITLRPRQPGSAIKPVNYAIGIEYNLLTPSTLLLDIPTCFSVPGQPLYCPENYDNSFHGPTQVRFALGNSYNIPAVKTLTVNSLENFVSQARNFGISTFTDPKNYGLSLTLGGGEVKMADLAVAYSVLANQGERADLHPILKIEDYSGKILEEYKPDENETIPVISAETAYLVSHILLDNNARLNTFGPSSLLNIPGHPEVSVKTGTTNDKRDNWTIGFNPEIVVAVWVGNNDNTPLGAIASGITGASPIWNKIIKYALKNKKPVWPVRPEGIVGQTICSVSGLLPPDSANPASCFNGQFRFEYFRAANLPTQTETIRRDIPVDKSTGIQANAKTPPELIEFQNHSVVFDRLGSMLCLDCSGLPVVPEIISPKNFITPTPHPSP